MVVPDLEITNQDEAQLALQSDQQPRPNPVPLLGRQPSIYSLTLDEFQHTLCDNGKNFGSMNMDEFLNSIWTAEENQTQAQAHSHAHGLALAQTQAQDPRNVHLSMPAIDSDHKGSIIKQPSSPRQGSLSLPGLLSRKTVDEVWSEIQKAQHEQEVTGTSSNFDNSSFALRQTTFGEMTLEDFLVKAGVVREKGNQVLPISHQPFGVYQSRNAHAGGPTQIGRPVIGLAGAGVPAYPLPVSVAGVPAGSYGSGRAANIGGAAGGFASIGSPLSPVSPEGNQFGVDSGRMKGGRKRIIDGPVEKVVERRQRRMIKNRESAARSRARKQAYTVERDV